MTGLASNQGGVMGTVNDNVLSDKTNISKDLRGTNTKCSSLVWFLGKLDFKLWAEDTGLQGSDANLTQYCKVFCHLS